MIYVWWDALGNYLTALDYADDGENFGRWWTGASRRVHLLGKGVLRFHAVYWPAMLLSAGEAVPTDIVVHGYLTENGRKISKSSGATVDPYNLVGTLRHGRCALVAVARGSPGRDADFTVDRLVSRANDELANGVGNLVNRVVTMIHRYRDGRARPARRGGRARRPLSAAPWRTLRGWSPRHWTTSTSAGPRRRSGRSRTRRTATSTAPGRGICPGPTPRGANAVLSALLLACQAIGAHLAPFLPDAAARITRQCTPMMTGLLPPPTPLLPRITRPVPAPAPAQG